MPRTRTLAELQGDVQRRADIESATDRHPLSDLTRYINQGGAELRDLMIEVRGRPYFRKNPPQTINTTGGNTTRYALDPTFYRLISLRVQNDPMSMLVPFLPEDEAWLRQNGTAIQRPTHYELQPGFVELLPKHSAGMQIIVDYVPHYVDLVNPGDPLDGFDGWEEYVVCFAARCVAVKDEEKGLEASLVGEMARLSERIRKLTGGRDAFRAERVKDVRGSGGSWPWGPYGWRGQ